MLERLIIFDFDGVLAEINWESLFESYKHWIDKFKNERDAWKHFFIDLDSFVEWYDMDWRENTNRVGCRKKRDIQEAIKDFEKIFDKRNEKLFPWVSHVVKKLSGKHYFAILTSGSAERVRSSLITKNPFMVSYSYYFPMIIGYENVKKLKPYPEGIFTIIKYFENLGRDLKTKNIVIIGDTKVDVLAGKNADILTGVVKWGLAGQKEKTWKELLLLKPDYIFEKPEDLLRI